MPRAVPPLSYSPWSPSTAHLRFWQFTASALVLLPWLNPFSFGPTAPAVQWLVTLAVVAGLLLLGAVWHATVPQAKAPWARSIAWGWLLAGLLSSLIALLQYTGHSAAWAPWINITSTGEAFANLRQRNQFATLTNMALASLCWVVVLAQGARVRWLHVGLAMLLGLGNAASASRTGLLQLGLLAGLVVLWGGWRHASVRRVLLAAVLAYGLALVLLPVLIGQSPLTGGALARLQQDAPACTSRLVLWRNVLELIAQRPWLGWGWGELDYAHFMHLYAGGPDDRFCAILDNAHNLPLHLAVELGLPFALLLCGLAAWAVWRGRPWREADPTRQLAWAVLALIGLHALLEYPLWYGPFLLAAGLCGWLLWWPPRWVVPAVVQAGLACGLLAATAWVGWDYFRISQLYLRPSDRAPAYRHDPMAMVGGSVLFGDQVRFAMLSTTPPAAAHARAGLGMAQDLLHFSPEPRVIERVVEYASLLGQDDLVAAHMLRYRAAFPEEFAVWSAQNKAVAQALRLPAEVGASVAASGAVSGVGKTP